MTKTLLAWDLDELAVESAAAPFDCVVVGGGSAGLTTARTLAERGRRVAVLEAGPAPLLTNIFNTELRFSRALTDSVRSQVQYGPSLPDGSQFGPNFGCLGGRGMFWNGTSPRFRGHDFAGWPLGPGDLAPYYEWAEREFRVSSRVGATRLASAIIEALRGAGFDAVPCPFAADLEPVGEGRLSAGIASGLGVFLRGSGDALASGAVRVCVASPVARLLLSGGEVRGVTASTGAGGAVREILGRSVVLAAGGVESIRLAAVSGVPDPGGRIGVGIQDHIFYRCFFDGAHLYGGAPESAAAHVPSPARDAEQWEIHAPGRRLFSVDDGSEWSPAAAEPYQLMARAFAPTEKRDANRVECREGPPGSATVHFGYSPADEERKESMRRQAERIAAALGLTRSGEGRFARPGGSYHEAGGLDMGTDRATSVTDPEGRFHLVPNLVCLDAAAWPRIGAASPHLTIVALARRGAERLAARL
ncbi:MAG TPA: GMC family oxidoreductase [Longimicrobium sp.]|nr:GMC family oxidoreductase [Longimicrobium sp.]